MRRHLEVLGRGAAVCAFLAVSGAAWAGVLFVDDNAPGTGNGSLGRPYDTISKAVAAASDPARFSPSSTVVIFVGPGTYDEPLPIVLDREKLRVVGTTWVPWVDGFPSAPTSPLQSVIPWKPGSPPPSTFRITEDDVQVEGFTFVGPGQAAAAVFNTMDPTIDINGSNVQPQRTGEADFIEGAVVRRSAFLGERVGVRTIHASATVEGTYIEDPFLGMSLFAGPAGAGSSVLVRGNRIVGSLASAIIAFGQTLVPGRAGELAVEVVYNDLSHNGRKQTTGNNFGAGLQAFTVTDNGINQDLPAHLTLDVHHNVFVGNRHYGVALNSRAAGPSSSPSTLDASVEHNTFCGNGNNDVMVSTTFFFKAACPAVGGNLASQRPASGADWDVTLGPDVGWDYSITDYTGANSHGPNHVSVNGVEITAPGVSITPWPGGLDGCNPDQPSIDTCEE